MSKKKQSSDLNALVDHMKHKPTQDDTYIHTYENTSPIVTPEHVASSKRYILRSYHLTEEQDYKIGMAAAAKRRTRAEIVRAAIDLYFST